MDIKQSVLGPALVSRSLLRTREGIRRENNRGLIQTALAVEVRPEK